MKRIVFLLIFLMVSVTIVEAQGRDMRRASRHLNRGNLDRAMEHIQDAMEYEEVLEDPEIWVLKGELYMQIATAEEPEYRALADNPVDKADEAMRKAIELDEDDDFMIDIQQLMLFLSELVFNEGVEAYNIEDWDGASRYFYRAYDISKDFAAKDTTTLYNAALAAELGQDFDNAYEWYKDLREMEYDDPFLYSSLSNIAMHKQDTTNAKKYISEGRERYPDDLDLIFAEANIYIHTGDTEEASRVLDIAIQRDPENPGLYFAFGANYDQMSQDTVYYDKEEREFAFQEAVKAYEQAIELEPEFFDALYNLGALYFNKGLDLFEEAEERLRETQDFAQYEEDEKEVREIWMEAQPYLEDAYELIDEDHEYFTTVLISLSELYLRTGQEEEFEEIRPLYEKYFGEEGEMMD